jgi:signal transduction histidine kinase
MVKPVASHGKTGYLDDIRISISDESAGRGPTGAAICKGSYYICNDFLSDPCTRPWQKKALAGGFKSSASITLKLNGEVIGALTIYAGEKDFFKWQFINLLQQMATDVSFALDNLDREAKRREAELALRTETAERLRAVEELRERDRLLLQQSRQAALGEMIGNIAHQWRQPLNALGLVIQELSLAYELGNFTREHLDASIDGAMDIIYRMSQTIDDFSNFYKPDREKRWFKVNEVVTKTLSLIDASFLEYRIAVDADAADDLEIKGYPNDYAQVLLNILMNARDVLLERGTVNPRVTVRARMEKGRSVVTVSDNAGGIGEAILDRIFDLYFTTKESGLGTGIGLFMAKTIIEKNMGGSLTAHNARYGAEFRIEV